MPISNTFSEINALSGIPRGGRIHFIGIGGVGMCALAMLAQDMGYSVTGSDRSEGENIAALRKRGISVTVGVFSPFFGANAAVYTLAIDETDENLIYARNSKIPLFSRADFLGLLGDFFPVRIGIAGMHGKSTVTAMVADILTAAGKEPTVLCGARMADGAVYRKGGGEVLLYEACEYRDSFLATRPTIPVVLNLDYDHPDWFSDMEDVKRSFSRYLRKPSVTCAVVNGEDRELATVLQGVADPILRYGEGMAVAATEQTADAFPAFSLRIAGETVGLIRLSVKGAHNVQNALAAAAACTAVGVLPKDICRALRDFRGLHRRMELLGIRNGISVYDDYAHHPTELKAAIAAARGEKGRLFCVFQPHTYSRTAALMDAFCDALRLCDECAVMETYAAREKENPHASGKALSRACGGVYIEDAKTGGQWIKERVRAGDTVLLAGAGDVFRVWDFFGK